MAVVKALVGLALSASIGIIFLILGCALPQLGIYWPLFNIIFYLLAPLPILFSRRNGSSDETSKIKEWGYFFATGIVISAFALPIVLFRVEAIKGLACGLVTIGNIFVFVTIWGFFKTFGGDDEFGY